MRKRLLTAFAAAAFPSGAMLGNRAEAMTLAAPSALGVAAADRSHVEKAAIVCGYYGCVRVWPRYYGYGYGYGPYGRPYGYYGGPYGYYGRPYGWYGRRW